MAEPGREAADQGASVLLERLATAPEASPAVREGALDLLRDHHEAAGRAGDLVRVVEAALPLADVERQIALHRDAAQRLAELGKHDAAIEHYAELLRLDPASTTTQRALRQLAQAADRMDHYAAAAAAAAERCPDPPRKVALLTDAARVRIDLDDEVGATELLRAALGEPGIPRSDVLTVARRLDELLARAGRTAERLPVLEKLAAAETVPSSQRALIGDIARLAEELGQTDRALGAWRQRLGTDAADLGALGALIDLLEKEERWPELIEALEQRAGAPSVRHGQKRADLVRVSRLFERELGDELVRDQHLEPRRRAGRRARDRRGRRAHPPLQRDRALARAGRSARSGDRARVADARRSAGAARRGPPLAPGRARERAALLSPRHRHRRAQRARPPRPHHAARRAGLPRRLGRGARAAPIARSRTGPAT